MAETTQRVLILDVETVDGESPVDVLVEGGRIAALAPAGVLEAEASAIEGRGRLVMPGFVDAHSHAAALLDDPGVQLAQLRQGITTVIAGQDGVGPAPGDGRYAAEYFAAIDGRHRGSAGGGIGALLAAADGTSPINVAALVPAGTVRFEVMCRATRAPSAAELAAMVALVREGLAEGAVGLSTGLDYVPGLFASTDELTALARPVAEAGGVFVSHMRGGYESGSASGIAELTAISRGSGAPIHVSHFHAEPHLVLGLLDRLEADGIDATFDAYPYGRGCSLLGMPLLPPEISVLPVDAQLARLTDSAERERLLAEWFPTIVDYPSLGPDWPAMLTFAHIGAPEYDWAHGKTVAEASVTARRTPAEFALDVLVASRLEVNVVMAVRTERRDADLARILAHPAAMGGSDGIFVGRHPHPRARGTFARYLELLVRDGSLDWVRATGLVSSRAVDRFALGDRGRVRPGAIADLVLVDPDRVGARATYDDPLATAVGIDDVLVGGIPVLAGGELTGEAPGRGIRRASRPTERQEA
ncbi:amidohydrolase family protein [Agromyces sp. CFH 90414]|uniref:Amidohydrolase family protein n=1 Tax=Agromyces agglutinans TaxID=2662258 RepID=A0A6I2FEK0_9MICO|nr:amidohydrolase family protein [Agromyces agglutinans]MRG61120.1 amidohydrolase family protein [Agromyces agglutinans]